MTTKTKAKPDKKAKADKTPGAKNGKITGPKKEALLKDKIDDLQIARRDFADACSEWELRHAEASESKKFMERLQQTLNGIVKDICDIQSGNYTPTLPFGEPPKSGAKAETNGHVAPGAASLADEGAKMPLSALIEFGLTESKIDLLKEKIGGATVGHLEKFQRENVHWDRDVKGLGPEWVNKVLDAQIDFRKRHSMPEAAANSDGTNSMPNRTAFDAAESN